MIQPYRMEGVALVTGAASGIGRATAIAFAYEGVTRIVLADLDVEGMKETSAQLKALDSSIQTVEVRTDTSSEASVNEMVSQAVAAFGAIHYCVNSAGVTSEPRAVSHELPIETWDRIMSINLRGVWLCQRAQITQMLKQQPQDANVMRLTRAPAERGSIVNISSVLGRMGNKNAGSYSAAKHGVLGISRTDASAYGKDGIRINSVCPGVILTPLLERSLKEGSNYDKLLALLPISRYGTSEEVAQTVVFLASPRASLITGEEVCVDGGMLHCV